MGRSGPQVSVLDVRLDAICGALDRLSVGEKEGLGRRHGWPSVAPWHGRLGDACGTGFATVITACVCQGMEKPQGGVDSRQPTHLVSATLPVGGPRRAEAWR